MKRICILFMFITVLFLSSCNTYNAKLYDFAIEWINDSIKEVYEIEVEEIVEGEVTYLRTPKYTLIINDEEEYNKVFKLEIEELNIDFDKKMIVVYTFNSIYVWPIELKKINYQNSSLDIEYKYDLIPGTGSACEPYQRWLVLVMNKIEVTEITFTERRR